MNENLWKNFDYFLGLPNADESNLDFNGILMNCNLSIKIVLRGRFTKATIVQPKLNHKRHVSIVEYMLRNAKAFLFLLKLVFIIC